MKKELGFIGFFFGLCLITGVRHAVSIPIMGDELVAYYLATLPSPATIFSALSEGADSQGPLYYIVTWIWLKLTHQLEEIREIAIRLPSILCWGATLYVTQRLLRKEIETWLSTALALTLLAWPESLLHLAEGRGYGLIMLLISLTVLCSNKILVEYQKKDWLLALGIIQGTAILTHPLGAIYSAPIIATLIGTKWMKDQKAPWKTALATGSGWILIIPWLPSLRGQFGGTLASGVRWADPPSLNLLWDFLQPETAIVTLVAVNTIGSWLTKKTIDQKKEITNWTSGTTLVITGLALWGISHISNPLFTGRYTLPVQLGWILIGTSIVATARTPEKWQKRTGIIGTIILTGIILTSTTKSRETTGGFSSKNPWIDAGFADKKYLKEPEIPVVCETSTTYLPRHYYIGTRYTLVLNKEAAENDGGPAAMDYKMNAALALHDPRQNIVGSVEFKKRHEKFYLWDEKYSSTGERAFPEQEYNRKEIPLGTNPTLQSIRLFFIEKKKTSKQTEEH